MASVLLQGRHALPFQAASSTCRLHDLQESRCSFLCPACCAHRSPLVLQMGLAQCGASRRQQGSQCSSSHLAVADQCYKLTLQELRVGPMRCQQMLTLPLWRQLM